MSNLKELLEKLKKATEVSDELDKAWGMNPEDEELEKRWDEAYKAEHAAAEELVAGLVSFSGNRLTERTAWSIVRSKQKDLEFIINYFFV